MQTYVEFYRPDIDWSIGTFAIRRLDGRMSLGNLVHIVSTARFWKNYAKGFGYTRFRIFKCGNLRENWKYVTDFIPIKL